MVVRIAGERTYLWRAVDHEDEVVLSAPLVVSRIWCHRAAG
jgi:transposase-like protein